MKHLPETSSAWMVIELVSMNCIADQPSSSPLTEPFESEGTVRAHADRVDHAGHESPDGVGILEPAAPAAIEIDRREHAPRRRLPPRGAKWKSTLHRRASLTVWWRQRYGLARSEDHRVASVRSGHD